MRPTCFRVLWKGNPFVSPLTILSYRPLCSFVNRFMILPYWCILSVLCFLGLWESVFYKNEVSRSSFYCVPGDPGLLGQLILFKDCFFILSLSHRHWYRHLDGRSLPSSLSFATSPSSCLAISPCSLAFSRTSSGRLSDQRYQVHSRDEQDLLSHGHYQIREAHDGPGSDT